MNVTEIPIEIKGALNGMPWCTTIRLRIKHDANEKPTFIPNRCKIFRNLLQTNLLLPIPLHSFLFLQTNLITILDN